jgi:hypothetical protein
MEKRPVVIVEDALERKPPEKVARPVCVSVPVCVVLPLTVSEPRLAICEKRLVDDAVVEKKLVEVALVSVVLPLKVEVALQILVPLQVLLLARSVVDAPVKMVWLCQYAAEVVENANP